MKIKVKVTKTDIKRGIRESPTSCPVARAIDRAAGRPCALVGHTEINIVCSDAFGRQRIEIPNSVKKWIHRFDLDKVCLPFNFMLEVPDAFRR